MSGHSKWSTIKRQKGVADAKRSQLFTKFGRLITVAAHTGTDPASNFKLRLAIDKARAANMPRDTIERAIKRASGESSGLQLEEVVYEAYGPGGVALVIEATTDNRQRTVASVKHVLLSHNGRLVESGSVRWQFEPRGVIQLPEPTDDRQELELALIEAGATDLRDELKQLVIYTQPLNLDKVKAVLAERGLLPDYAQVELVAKQLVTLDTSSKQQLEELVAELDNLDDVDNVYTNEA